jgi:hypothetical protein
VLVLAPLLVLEVPAEPPSPPPPPLLVFAVVFVLPPVLSVPPLPPLLSLPPLPPAVGPVPPASDVVVGAVVAASVDPLSE